MKKFFISVLANTIALMLIDYVSQAVSFNGNVRTVIVLSIIITILNSTVKPLLQFLSFPITVATLGLFRLIVNGAVLMLAFNLTDGATINGLLPAVVINIVLSMLSGFIEGVFSNDDRKKK